MITCTIPSSPILSHPSTEIIEGTLQSIRAHLPFSKIIVMLDGVREEQKHMAERYAEYSEALERIVQSQYNNIVIQRFPAHRHQVGMMREVVPSITTPLILFCESDTPLVTDEMIEWEGCAAAIMSGDVNLVRFLHEAHIHPSHEYLMEGQIESHGVRLTRTKQFSARPHLATKDFYIRVLQCFSPDAVAFVEDRMHSVCQTDSWDTWKMSVYTPSGNMKRSLHADGRAGGPKYDDTQQF